MWHATRALTDWELCLFESEAPNMQEKTLKVDDVESYYVEKS